MERIEGIVQRYAWGDRRAIAEIQGRAPSGEPEAELWLGAHPVAPSIIADGSGLTLADLSAARPTQLMGPIVEERFGAFPYLLKILAAAEPLSIQAHPSLDQGRSGFEREEAAGIAWDDPSRTYRDRNHKPELICALTDFEAKCGFRPVGATSSLIDALCQTTEVSASDRGPASPVGLGDLAKRLRAGGDEPAVLAGVLAWLLHLPSVEVGPFVAETVRAASHLLASRPDVTEADFGPELRWTVELDRAFPGDIGVVVALLLNHVSLAPGQAMFLEAGNLHSYLRGTGVELMANSDNVVRGGLTIKHIDVDELLSIVNTEPGPAPVQTPVSNVHHYESAVSEFALTRVVGGADPQRFEPVGPEILLVTDGAAAVNLGEEGRTLQLGVGQAAIVEASDGPYRLDVAAAATVWRATVGDLAGA